jgi:probable HAF family extracellular repeat protein
MRRIKLCREYSVNSLIPADSGWTLVVATGINEAGQIVGSGLVANGETHAFLLTPDHGRLSPRSIPLP